MKSSNQIPIVLNFLDQLKENNNREWFELNKAKYTESLGFMIDFADELLLDLASHDTISTATGKASLYRIYADTRFSKDKAPYKNHWGIRFGRATLYLRGGYYVHIEPNNTFVAGGFFSPNAEDLLRIRKDIELNYEDWFALLNTSEFKKHFGTIQGKKLKTCPKGFAKDHPGLELLKYQQFIIKHSFTDAEVKASNFSAKISEMLCAFRPFFDHMSEVLTTDANGESIV